MTRVPLSQIDLKDRRFSLSYQAGDDKLTRSVASVGIIEPVILLDRTPYVVISGFKRLAAARSLRMRSVPAVIVDVSEETALLMAIHDNLVRGYTIIEKAAVLDKVLRSGLPRDGVMALMRELDLNPHEKVLASFLALQTLDGPVKDFIDVHRISFRNIDMLLRFDVTERKRIVQVLKGFRVTESTLREILEMLLLMKIRKQNLTARDIPRRENADALRTFLKEKTQPILTSLQKKLKKIRDAMALPAGVDIRVDPFFEKEYIDVTVRISDESDLSTALLKLSELAAAGHIGSILELTKGRIR